MVAERIQDAWAHKGMADTSEPKPLCWSKDQYYQMAEMGWFDGKRVELIEGEIVQMSPMNTPHWMAVVLAGERLRQVFASGYIVSTQLPLNMGENSEPEPDVAVIAGDVRDYKDAIPTTALLVVEVSDTTLAYDRTRKASLYARGGVPEYWIVNLVERVLEVYRDTLTDEEHGFGYRSMESLTATETVRPIAAPHAAIAVGDLLP